jgi:Fe-S-cluster-containing hydrogenase component 2
MVMSSKNNSLIAYNLSEEIIAPLCTICGACEVACPVDALKLKGQTVQQLYDCSSNIALCPICYEICLRSEALLLRSQM